MESSFSVFWRHLFSNRGPELASVLIASCAMAGCQRDAAPPAARPAEPAPTATLPLATGRAMDGQAPSAAQNVGSFPVNMAVSADGKFVFVTDAGYRQSIWSLRASDGQGVSHVTFRRTRGQPANGLYYGLAVAPDGTVYAAQGNRDAIAVLAVAADGALRQTRSIATRESDFPAGLALDGRGLLYVTNNDPIRRAAKLVKPAARSSRSTTRPAAPQPPGSGKPAATPPSDIHHEDEHAAAAAVGLSASVAIYDAQSGREVGRVPLPGAVPGTSVFPLSIAALRDGRRVYAVSERDGGVYVIDASDAAHARQITFIATGANPDAALLDKSQRRLFVANAGSDTISVIDTRADRVTETVLLRPQIARNLAGATPTGLALSPDEKTLYATLADMNAVAVIALSARDASALRGYVPAAWYPTAIVVSPDGQRLHVANAKGTRARVPHDYSNGKVGALSSPLNLLEGVVTTLPAPREKDLPAMTQRVLSAARLTPADLDRENPLAPIGLRAGRIEHVIYIVKENRTYDQVLGDVKAGNGDINRCIFGREVTPNQHALAERFVLFDNFYDAGEVSGDGWTWSTQAQANEYTQRNVPYNYSSRGRRFDFEGQNNDYLTGGFPAKGPDGKPLSEDPRFANGAKAIPDVAESPGGHLWDLARKAGLSYRNYGFFSSNGVIRAGKVILPENYPTAAGLQPGGHDLAGVTDVDFRRFDLDYPDSDARKLLATKTGDKTYYTPKKKFGKHDAPSRYSEWKQEFDEMLSKDPSGAAVPALTTIRFCTDHTLGLSAGKHTPRSLVADNDYAVGQLVEAVSHSAIWKKTAIFIIEDDAQNGPDHVDLHRSTCYVISPWIKAHAVDHTFQNTVSVIRTMELLLNLGPMCQYDAAAKPILDWDKTPRNAEPYTAVLPDEQILREAVPKLASASSDPKFQAMIEASGKMDFAHADRAPAEALNRIIWASVKGTASEMPPTPGGPIDPRQKSAPDQDDD